MAEAPPTSSDQCEVISSSIVHSPAQNRVPVAFPTHPVQEGCHLLQVLVPLNALIAPGQKQPSASKDRSRGASRVPPYQEVPTDDESSLLVARSPWVLLGEAAATRGFPAAAAAVSHPVSLEDLAA